MPTAPRCCRPARRCAMPRSMPSCSTISGRYDGATTPPRPSRACLTRCLTRRGWGCRRGFDRHPPPGRHDRGLQRCRLIGIAASGALFVEPQPAALDFAPGDDIEPWRSAVPRCRGSARRSSRCRRRVPRGSWAVAARLRRPAAHARGAARAGDRRLLHGRVGGVEGIGMVHDISERPVDSRRPADRRNRRCACSFRTRRATGSSCWRSTARCGPSMPTGRARADAASRGVRRDRCRRPDPPQGAAVRPADGVVGYRPAALMRAGRTGRRASVFSA